MEYEIERKLFVSHLALLTGYSIFFLVYKLSFDFRFDWALEMHVCRYCEEFMVFKMMTFPAPNMLPDNPQKKKNMLPDKKISPAARA
jgi:hypothetical protein